LSKSTTENVNANDKDVPSAEYLICTRRRKKRKKRIFKEMLSERNENSKSMQGKTDKRRWKRNLFRFMT
jgi:hypothetical protein